MRTQLLSLDSLPASTPLNASAAASDDEDASSRSFCGAAPSLDHGRLVTDHCRDGVRLYHRTSRQEQSCIRITTRLRLGSFERLLVAPSRHGRGAHTANRLPIDSACCSVREGFSHPTHVTSTDAAGACFQCIIIIINNNNKTAPRT